MDRQTNRCWTTGHRISSLELTAHRAKKPLSYKEHILFPVEIIGKWALSYKIHKRGHCDLIWYWVKASQTRSKLVTWHKGLSKDNNLWYWKGCCQKPIGIHWKSELCPKNSGCCDLIQEWAKASHPRCLQTRYEPRRSYHLDLSSQCWWTDGQMDR